VVTPALNEASEVQVEAFSNSSSQVRRLPVWEGKQALLDHHLQM
jgi:hypothetical protein